MSFLTKLERKMGWISIANLPIYIVSAQGLVYIWGVLNPGQMHLLILDPRAVLLGGEYWRLLTYLFVVPTTNPLFAFFYLYLLYIYGSALEQAWGSFSFTFFYLIGALGTTAAALIFGNAGGSFYLNATLFLAFAALNPDFTLHLFFIIPVKIKWLALLTWIWFAYMIWVAPLFIKVSIGVALSNYFLFFAKEHARQAKEWLELYQHRRKFKDWNK